jgi:hypothetical protein
MEAGNTERDSLILHERKNKQYPNTIRQKCFQIFAIMKHNSKKWFLVHFFFFMFVLLHLLCAISLCYMKVTLLRRYILIAISWGILRYFLDICDAAFDFDDIISFVNSHCGHVYRYFWLICKNSKY